MQIALKNILSTLFKNKESQGQIRVVTSENKFDDNEQRCLDILNYWLDIELFDLPECPFQKGNDILSVEADFFLPKMKDELQDKLISNPQYITEKSRLVIMFQCHKAGYIVAPDERHPNFVIPRTYLVSHSFAPVWDPDEQILRWSLSEEDQDLIINLSTIRTIFRKCPLAASENLSLSAWISTCVDDIENLFKEQFKREETGDLFDTDELQQKIKLINRVLASRFWPEESAQAFMMQHCSTMETEYGHAEDSFNPVKIVKSNELTFRWRFGFYPEGNDQQQLGPFFVEDLEHCIRQLMQEGQFGLSKALQAYLLGTENQRYIPEATNQGTFFLPLIDKVPLGRWLSSPAYGLSLLQTLAVNVAKEDRSNPIVAVNGPPGTGKTTLLKDIIADRFVHRTFKLLELHEKKEELLDTDALNEIMHYSMIVASSNNKAVENISKELPASANIDPYYSKQLSHFSSIANEGEWGTFCAVLGNSANRKEFKHKIRNLKYHLRNINDRFKLNKWLKALQEAKQPQERLALIAQQIQDWLEHDQISQMLADFDQCSHTKTYTAFYTPFKKALLKIEAKELSTEEFLQHWQNLTDSQWDELIEALEKIKKQWFGKKLYQPHLETKLKSAKKEFSTLYQQISHALGAGDQLIVNEQNIKNWNLDLDDHLLHTKAFKLKPGANEEDVEHALQQRSPLGSRKLNDARSRLFAAALNLNEALIESQAKSLEKHFDNLLHLLDGHLETQENPPQHQLLWSLLFLFFPVISTSLSSVENQFKLMQKQEGFGLAMIDEAGQAVSYHVVGLLQRCKQVVFVGDPIQLEPVVTIPYQIDKSIAQDYLKLAEQYPRKEWGDHYLISSSSAQSIADQASHFYAMIGERKVGIPLLVHRRCLEPMFSIANRIAYDNKMVSATSSKSLQDLKFLPSGWINVEEQAHEIRKGGYSNQTEAEAAIELIKYLVEHQPKMIEGGIFIITPFSIMRKELTSTWSRYLRDETNHPWMIQAFGKNHQNKPLKQFMSDNIGTVHTFQGKEASTVILCVAASNIRKKNGGISWVNSKPNLINVAVTRAKSHFFVIGNQQDWSKGTLSAELQDGYMHLYQNLNDIKTTAHVSYDEMLKLRRQRAEANTFYFGG